MIKQSLALALAAAATLSAPAAFAAPAEGAAVAVQYSDLDLGTEKGQKTLERRLDAAARTVCGMDETTTGSRLVNGEARSCYKSARQQLAEQFAELTSNTRRGG